MQWYLKALKQYADFGGRARRTEFWMFVLINVLISLVLAIIDTATGTANAYASVAWRPTAPASSGRSTHSPC